ncbi:uncharacterized protein LOC131031119 [Cryptomeria japonica]|uniref:uncharacterized protein LOC131031119 n=1 Tax=Cryptomeria japonica TaxID=3369 RepID=UPI0027DA1306|nr:uncharacterized protein LOC131031119 [Cryptomeria japonica]
MSDKEFGEEADIMPPKTMSQEAIKTMVEELLAERLKEVGQWKGKEKVGGDESEDEQENEREEAIAKEVQKMPADQKIFVDALKSVNRDNVESLPTYGGSLNGEEVLDWIEALNNHFEYKEVLEEKKVSLARARLKGSALMWWTVLQEERVNAGKKRISSWERMKTKIKNQFLPCDFEVQMFKKIQNFRQRELDVSSYTEEFHRLSLRSRKHEDESEKLARYINGLRQNIQDEISVLAPDIVHKCFQLALRIEDKIRRRGEQNQKSRGGKKFRGRGSFGRGGGPPKNGESNIQEGNGETSGREGGFRGGFRGGRFNGRGKFGNQGRGPSVFTGKCYQCNQVGHTMSRCPEKTSSSHGGDRRTQLVQEEDSSSVSPPIGRAGPTLEGESLMLKRTLLKIPQHKEPPQRKSLFRTTCVSFGKVCKVIIDSSSTENIVALEMVEKLKLKRLPHTTPYKVSWLNKGQHVVVDEQAWVDFEIGEYKDRILCDILPMDACHLLLGCPWQFDVKAIHNGELNTYVITKNGRRYEMDPLLDQGSAENISPSIMMLRGKEFHKMMKNEGAQGYAVMLKPKEKPMPNSKEGVPKEVQELLERYKGVVVNDLPIALPPMRDISHQIDLIPGATLPNKAAYKMTPAQNEEIAKQVQELLDKGLIRKSLSPCAVPTVLEPKKDGTWRMCTDSRAINKITIRYRFPMPRIEDLLDYLGGACYFSKVDLKSGYHQIRIRQGDEWKTAFKTNEGLYEWMVMPFGLTNASSTFMRLMNEVLVEFIGKFVIVYLDDILIFSRSKEEHIKHLNMEKLNQRHLKWVEYLQAYKFTIKHKKGVSNKVVDALSRRVLIVKEIQLECVGLEALKGLYKDDKDFHEIYEDGLLFKGHLLCIPQCSMRENIIKEKHQGSLGGHFGLDKTLEQVNRFYHWPKLQSDVRRFVEQCSICQRAKGVSTNAGLY